MVQHAAQTVYSMCTTWQGAESSPLITRVVGWRLAGGVRVAVLLRTRGRWSLVQLCGSHAA